MNPEQVPKQMQDVYDQIVAITDAECQEHLNDEYAQLSRRLAAALARKRPSPLAQGRPKSWAAGIVYALGQLNFLFDPDQTPHTSAKALVELFGVSQQTAASKAKVIRDLLDIDMFDWKWMLPSQLADSSQIWLLSVNDLIVDVRQAPRDLQEIAFEKGLIPFIPDDQ